MYAVQAPGGTLIIDAGTGRWLDHVDQLPEPPAAVLLTHYFRDHSAGALRAAAAGIPVYVGEHDQEKYIDPAQHFRERRSYMIYDCEWDQFSPIEAVPLAGVLHDYATVEIAGLSIEIIPLPGAPMSQIGFGIRLPQAGMQAVFSGETIHSPGRVPRVAPLQYDYCDVPGLANVYYSAQVLRQRTPDALLPSLGEPILDRVDAALSQLQDNLRTLCRKRETYFGGLPMEERLDLLHGDPLVQVTEHLYFNRCTNAYTWLLISESGKAMALDYGYLWFPVGMARYPKQDNRRPLLHSVDALKKQFGIDRIDVVLLSHFHDDHVIGVPMLQRLYGTECWAADTFADLVEQPQAHTFPCTMTAPIKVDRRFGVDETVRWEEYEFHFAPMSGHTRFAALIGFEVDGKRIAHVGDQYIFQREYEAPSESNPIIHSFVYRNGALLDGFEQSARWLARWKPDIFIGGHISPTANDDQLQAMADGWAREVRESHEQAMPLAENESHFNMDSWCGWIWPYRLHLAEPGPASVRVTVRNPLPREAMLAVRLVGPTGWQGTSATLPAPGRAEVEHVLEITPDGPCRRQPFALELDVEGRPFGQVAEALMTVGGPAW